MSDPSGISAYMGHLDRAIDRANTGISQRPRSPTPRERAMLARHEAELEEERRRQPVEPLTDAMRHGQSVFTTPGLLHGTPVGGIDHLAPLAGGIAPRTDLPAPRPSGRRHSSAGIAASAMGGGGGEGAVGSAEGVATTAAVRRASTSSTGSILADFVMGGGGELPTLPSRSGRRHYGGRGAAGAERYPSALPEPSVYRFKEERGEGGGASNAAASSSNR